MKLGAVFILAFLFSLSCSLEDSNNRKSDVLFNHLSHLISLNEQDTNYLIIITRNGCSGCFQARLDSILQVKNKDVRIITSSIKIANHSYQPGIEVVLDSTGGIDKLPGLNGISCVTTYNGEVISIKSIE